MSTGIDKTETGRIEIFSDGVFAIAITLLGLDRKVPAHDGTSLAASLAAGWASYVSFFTSFITIAIIWINHHRIFMHIVRVDHALLLLNALLLMTVTLVPFGTAVLANHLGHSGQRTAAMFYSGVFIAVTGAFNLLWLCAAVRHRLLERTVDQRAIRRISLQYGAGPGVVRRVLRSRNAQPLGEHRRGSAVRRLFCTPRVELEVPSSAAGHRTKWS